MVKHSLSWS